MSKIFSFFIFSLLPTNEKIIFFAHGIEDIFIFVWEFFQSFLKNLKREKIENVIPPKDQTS